ncbi:hypothetical protein Barb7_02189 [Bacteroidales bacterium Barb7]|nr:hypothetical protein Barb7_02189 [Bacteroidales bacterium Barb7]
MTGQIDRQHNTCLPDRERMLCLLRLPLVIRHIGNHLIEAIPRKRPFNLLGTERNGKRPVSRQARCPFLHLPPHHSTPRKQ